MSTAMDTHRGLDDRPRVSRRGLLAAAIATVLGTAWASNSRGRQPNVVSQVIAGAPPSPRRDVATVAFPIPTVPPPVISVPTLEHALVEGNSGDDVAALQRRLAQLGFDPGPPDGVFGPATARSVWAFEKLVLGVTRQAVSGVVDEQMWRDLHGDVRIVPRRERAGKHVEVYLPEQVVCVFNDGAVELVSHASTGSGEEWCQIVTMDQDDGTQVEEGICGRSVTPGGEYHFERRFAGWRESKLGRLYNPVYFNYGIAIHGASQVPNRPASRGCVRIPLHIAEYFPQLVRDGDTVFVFDGEKEPETYGAQSPVFDWPDPDFSHPPSSNSESPTDSSRPPSAPTSGDEE